MSITETKAFSNLRDAMQYKKVPQSAKVASWLLHVFGTQQEPSPKKYPKTDAENYLKLKFKSNGKVLGKSGLSKISWTRFIEILTEAGILCQDTNPREGYFTLVPSPKLIGYIKQYQIDIAFDASKQTKKNSSEIAKLRKENKELSKKVDYLTHSNFNLVRKMEIILEWCDSDPITPEKEDLKKKLSNIEGV